MERVTAGVTMASAVTAGSVETATSTAPAPNTTIRANDTHDPILPSGRAADRPPHRSERTARRRSRARGRAASRGRRRCSPRNAADKSDTVGQAGRGSGCATRRGAARPRDAGGMAERVRARDWSGTAVGPGRGGRRACRPRCPSACRRGSRCTSGGARTCTVFYNDAYVPAMGDKHPAALGRPAAEVWPEAWHELGPMAAVGARRPGGHLLRRPAAVPPPPRLPGGDVLDLLLLADPGRERRGRRDLRRRHRDDAAGSSASGGSACCATSVSSRRCPPAPRRRRAGRSSACSTRHRDDVPFAAAYLRAADGSLQLVASSGVRGRRHRGSAGPSAGRPTPSRCGGSPTTARPRSSAAWSAAPRTRSRRPPPGRRSRPTPSSRHSSIAGRSEPAGVLVAGVNPYRALDGDYRSFFDLVADQLSTAVTDALAYEAERQRAEALAELDRAKTDFFSNVSHEFRTPLTLIMGPVAELRAAPAVVADPWLREELDVVHRNALRLGKLVNSLLDFSRLQAGRVEAHFEPVDLAAYTAELASVFRSAVERVGVDYDVDVAPLPEPVYVDRDMWEQIVLNLLSNAVKFTFEGRISDRAAPRRALGGADGHRHRHRHPGRRAAAPVRALPPRGAGAGAFGRGQRHRAGGGARAGRPARRRDRRRQHTGPRHDVHRHAAPGPRAPAAGPDRPGGRRTGEARSTCRPPPSPSSPRRCGGSHGADAGRRPAEAAAPVAAQGRVLVADDNADMREYLSRLLRPRYAVQAVGDGAAALAAARQSPPDLVVSDVMMPGLGGMELLAALRADSAHRPRPGAAALGPRRAGGGGRGPGRGRGRLPRQAVLGRGAARARRCAPAARARAPGGRGAVHRHGRPRPGADLGGRPGGHAGVREPGLAAVHRTFRRRARRGVARRRCTRRTGSGTWRWSRRPPRPTRAGRSSSASAGRTACTGGCSSAPSPSGPPRDGSAAAPTSMRGTGSPSDRPCWRGSAPGWRASPAPRSGWAGWPAW